MQLLAIDGPHGVRLPALDRPLRIGRAPDSDLLLADAQVSRRHALIEPRGDRLLLRDLGSRAGTEVNGELVPAGKSLALAMGDRVRVGPWRFELVAAVAPADSVEYPLDDAAVTELQQISAAERRADMAAFARFASLAAACASLAELDGLLLAELRRQGRLDAALLLLPGASGGVRLACADPPGTRPQGLSRQVLREADAGGVVLQPAAAHFERTQVGLAPAWSLCVALRGEVGTQAWLYGWSGAAEPPGIELGHFLRGLAELAQALRHGLLQRMRAERHAQLERDLEDAQQVQRRLLPPTSGRLGDLVHASLFRPGRAVSGDLLLLRADEAGRCCFVLGDVAGSGAGAGLLMAQLSGLLLAALPTGRPLAVIAGMLNHALLQVGGGRFATAMLGRFDPSAGFVELVDAGQGLVLVAEPGGALRPHDLAGGPPLGVVEFDYPGFRLPFPPGSRLLLLSDGICELRGSDGSEFGSARAAAAVDSSPGMSIEALAGALEAWADPGQAPDDASALLIRREG